jgi:predicted DNA-binding transcriptional regulator YafY
MCISHVANRCLRDCHWYVTIPVLLGHKDGHWYLVARCHTAEAIRWFRLDRVEAANLTNERASDVPVDSVGTRHQAPDR